MKKINIYIVCIIIAGSIVYAVIRSTPVLLDNTHRCLALEEITNNRAYHKAKIDNIFCPDLRDDLGEKSQKDKIDFCKREKAQDSRWCKKYKNLN